MSMTVLNRSLRLLTAVSAIVGVGLWLERTPLEATPSKPKLSRERSRATVAEPQRASLSSAEAKVRLQKMGRMPLYFIENRGQLDSRVAYSVHGRDTAIYFAKEGITFSLIRAEKGESSSSRLSRASFGKESFAQHAPHRRWNIKLDFLDANPNLQILGRERTEAVVSYFKGSREDWKPGLPTYSSVLYRELWPGIDLLYSGTVDRLKYQFVVKPGADPERIRLSFSGASQVRVRNGALEVETPLGGFSDDRPYSYQEVGGRQAEVQTEYALSSVPGPSHAYGFRLGTYDRSRQLVIDPAVLVYAGFIGGSGRDQGFGIAVDAFGNAYVTGETRSTEATFPEMGGPDLTFNGGLSDAFVVKVNAAAPASSMPASSAAPAAMAGAASQWTPPATRMSRGEPNPPRRRSP
jgi:hypothetical protein